MEIHLEVVIVALDRANDRMATLFIAGIVRNLCLSNDHFNVNRFSVKRDRERARSFRCCGNNLSRLVSR